MIKLNFKEISKLKDLINDFIDFLNELKEEQKQKEALIVIKESLIDIQRKQEVEAMKSPDIGKTFEEPQYINHLSVSSSW